MGCQFSGNGMIFCRTPYGVGGLKLEPLKRRPRWAAGFPAGWVFPRPVWRFESGSGAIETLSAVGDKFFGGVSIFRAGGFCGGKCAAGVSLPSEWPSGQGVGSPRRVWFFGVESGVIQASAVIIGRCSGGAGVSATRRVFRDWAQGRLIAIRGGRLVLWE